MQWFIQSSSNFRKNLEKNNAITYKVDNFKNITGYDLAEEKQINYLEKLGFQINKQKSFFYHCTIMET